MSSLNIYSYDGPFFAIAPPPHWKIVKRGPGFANIFMGYLEKKFLSRCKGRPWVWWRFLDDVFMIWLHSEEELNLFLARLNSFHN